MHVRPVAVRLEDDHGADVGAGEGSETGRMQDRIIRGSTRSRIRQFPGLSACRRRRAGLNERGQQTIERAASWRFRDECTSRSP